MCVCMWLWAPVCRYQSRPEGKDLHGAGVAACNKMRYVHAANRAGPLGE